MNEIPHSAFADIIAELERRPLQVNNYRNKAGNGQSQAFGLVNRRCLPPDYSRNNWLRPYLYKLLLDFGAKYVDISFNAITLNQNYRADKHYDKHNGGDSYLVAFGSYTGGELEIHEGDLSGSHNIWCKPIRADFSKILHSVQHFTGNRYSLVYYQLTSTRMPENIPPPSVRKEGNKYYFFRGEEKIVKGLPHPLRDRTREEILRTAKEKKDGSDFSVSFE
jgi:hypothetical protein